MSRFLSPLKRLAGSEWVQDAASFAALCAFVTFMVFGSSIVAGLIIAERMSP